MVRHPEGPQIRRSAPVGGFIFAPAPPQRSRNEPNWGLSRKGVMRDCSYARSGPIHFVVLGTSGWDCIPCFTPALGRADDVAAFNAATAALGQLLRWFERAERADRRGRALASLVDALGRARAGAGASPRLRGCESCL